MPDITITISADDARIIRRLARKTGKTPKRLIEIQITNWTEGQIKGLFWDRLRQKTIAEMKQLLGEIDPSVSSSSASSESSVSVSV